jgi:hypothetical protein
MFIVFYTLKSYILPELRINLEGITNFWNWRWGSCSSFAWFGLSCLVILLFKSIVTFNTF